MKKFPFFLSIVVGMFILGCQNDELAIKKQQTQADLFSQMDMASDIKEDATELYFLSTKDKKYYTNIPAVYKKGWSKVVVVANDGNKYYYEIMNSPVQEATMYGNGVNKPVTDVSYSVMNDFCIKEMQGMLVSAYVFDTARKKHLIEKPTSGIVNEIIAPIDEEDEEQFYNDDDNIVGKEGTMIEFRWEDEKYYEVPNIYHSKEATFRCMRRK